MKKIFRFILITLDKIILGHFIRVFQLLFRQSESEMEYQKTVSEMMYGNYGRESKFTLCKETIPLYKSVNGIKCVGTQTSYYIKETKKNGQEISHDFRQIEVEFTDLTRDNLDLFCGENLVLNKNIKFRYNILVYFDLSKDDIRDVKLKNVLI